jgi:hypothetical protein
MGQLIRYFYLIILTVCISFGLSSSFVHAKSHRKFHLPKLSFHKKIKIDHFQNLPDEMVLKVIESAAANDLHSLFQIAQVNERFHNIAQSSRFYPSALASAELCNVLRSVTRKPDFITVVWGIALGLKNYGQGKSSSDVAKSLGTTHTCVLHSFDRILNVLIKLDRNDSYSLGHVNLMVALGMLQYPGDLGGKVYEKIWTLANFRATLLSASRNFLGINTGQSLMWPILNQFVKIYGRDWVLDKIEVSENLSQDGKSSFKSLVDEYHENSRWRLAVKIEEFQLKNSRKSIGNYKVFQWDAADSASVFSSYQMWSAERDGWFLDWDEFNSSRYGHADLSQYSFSTHLERLQEADFIASVFESPKWDDWYSSPVNLWTSIGPEVYDEIARAVATQQRDFSAFGPLVEKIHKKAEYAIKFKFILYEKDELFNVLAAIARYSSHEWAEKSVVPIAQQLREVNLSGKVYASLLLGPYRNDFEFQEDLINQLDQFSDDIHYDSLLGALAIVSKQSHSLEAFSRIKQLIELREVEYPKARRRKKKAPEIKWNLSQDRIAALVGLATRDNGDGY